MITHDNVKMIAIGLSVQLQSVPDGDHSVSNTLSDWFNDHPVEHQILSDFILDKANTDWREIANEMVAANKAMLYAGLAVTSSEYNSEFILAMTGK